jgi:hypothetical protein
MVIALIPEWGLPRGTYGADDARGRCCRTANIDSNIVASEREYKKCSGGQMTVDSAKPTLSTRHILLSKETSAKRPYQKGNNSTIRPEPGAIVLYGIDATVSLALATVSVPTYSV